jgi:hypothetical protein
MTLFLADYTSALVNSIGCQHGRRPVREYFLRNLLMFSHANITENTMIKLFPNWLNIGQVATLNTTAQTDRTAMIA